MVNSVTKSSRIGHQNLNGIVRKEAKALATRHGAVYPYREFLRNKVCGVIPESRREDLISTLLESEPDYLPLGEGRHFAFTKAGDDRLRTILLKIFSVYPSELPLNRLHTAMVNPLRNRPRVDENVLEQCGEVHDEYCLKVGYFRKPMEGMRACGPVLDKLIRSNDAAVVEICSGKLFKAERSLVDALREHGAPMRTEDFMKLLNAMDDATKNHIHGFPSLFRSDGPRRQMVYHTLDDKYGRGTATDKVLEKVVPDPESFDFEGMVKRRKEQTALRRKLFGVHGAFDESLQTLIAKCESCHQAFPADLLVASHVKKRSLCSDDEVGDTDNIAMLLCVTCDRLYENGYFAIDRSGHVVLTKTRVHTTVETMLKQIEGNPCDYWFGDDRRKTYCEHRYNQGKFA